ncbi:MAG: hypothetical protein IJC31_06060 [Spirochaetaceae bacterium]|nr:hypothetical protein [Spirochaetaceae bacterium]
MKNRFQQVFEASPAARSALPAVPYRVAPAATRNARINPEENMNETREEFYTRCLKDHGYICPANKFDLPNFSQVTFASACNADWCPYYKSVCRHFGGKRKSISERRKLAVELRKHECQLELFGEKELCLC